MIAASGFLSSSSSYWFEYHQRACIGSSRNTFTGKSSAPLGSKAGNSSWSSTTEFPHPQNYPYLIFWIRKSLLLLPFHQICMRGMVVLYSSLCSHRSMHGLCPAPWLRLPSLPTPPRLTGPHDQWELPSQTGLWQARGDCHRRIVAIFCPCFVW